MAKLATVMKKAIEEGDWDAICRIYTAMTGEPIEPPKLIIPSMRDMANLDMNTLDPLVTVQVEMDTEDDEEDDEEDEEAEEDDEEGIDEGLEEFETVLQQSPQHLVKPPKRTGAADYSEIIAPSKGKKTEQRLRKGDHDDDEVEARKVPMGTPLAGKKKVGILKKQWADSGKLHRKDVEIDRKLSVSDPIPRGDRDSTDVGVDTGKKMKVVCSECGGTFKVNPALAYGYRKKGVNTWKCNECTTSRRPQREAR